METWHANCTVCGVYIKSHTHCVEKARIKHPSHLRKKVLKSCGVNPSIGHGVLSNFIKILPLLSIDFICKMT